MIRQPAQNERLPKTVYARRAANGYTRKPLCGGRTLEGGEVAMRGIGSPKRLQKAAAVT
jgi:hypothetical protein